MRTIRFLGLLLVSTTCFSAAQGSVIQGISTQPLPAGISGLNIVVPNTGLQVDNEDYVGTLAGNPNQVLLEFTYNDTYLANPLPVLFLGAARDTINDGGAKEFTFTVNVTNSSSRALQEFLFTLDGPTLGGFLNFDDPTALTPIPISPLDGFIRPTPQVLKFGFLGGGSSVAPGATGSFVFSVDLPDNSNGTFTLAAQVTPEPASIGLALVAIGLGGIGIRRRRAKQVEPKETSV